MRRPGNLEWDGPYPGGPYPGGPYPGGQDPDLGGNCSSRNDQRALDPDPGWNRSVQKMRAAFQRSMGYSWIVYGCLTRGYQGVSLEATRSSHSRFQGFRPKNLFFHRKKKIVKNRFFKPRENPEKVRESPGKLQKKSMYSFGEVRKVSHWAGFAEFSCPAPREAEVIEGSRELST